MTRFELINQQIERYSLINECYNSYLNNSRSRNHPLAILLFESDPFLVEFENCLEKIKRIDKFSHLIKKSKNQNDFYSTYAEMKAILLFMEKNIPVEIIKAENSSPDLIIEFNKKKISCEIKSLKDKVTDDNEHVLMLIDDEITTKNSIMKSIDKGQFYDNLSHMYIFYLNWSADEYDFEDNLLSLEKGLFFEKSELGSFSYSMISGVAVVFETTSRSQKDGLLIVKKPRTMYFKNPNAKYEIEDSLLNKLNFEIN